MVLLFLVPTDTNERIISISTDTYTYTTTRERERDRSISGWWNQACSLWLVCVVNSILCLCLSWWSFWLGWVGLSSCWLYCCTCWLWYIRVCVCVYVCMYLRVSSLCRWWMLFWKKKYRTEYDDNVLCLSHTQKTTKNTLCQQRKSRVVRLWERERTIMCCHFCGDRYILYPTTLPTIVFVFVCYCLCWFQWTRTNNLFTESNTQGRSLDHWVGGTPYSVLGCVMLCCVFVFVIWLIRPFVVVSDRVVSLVGWLVVHRQWDGCDRYVSCGLHTTFLMSCHRGLRLLSSRLLHVVIMRWLLCWFYLPCMYSICMCIVLHSDSGNNKLNVLLYRSSKKHTTCSIIDHDWFLFPIINKAIQYSIFNTNRR